MTQPKLLFLLVIQQRINVTLDIRDTMCKNACHGIFPRRWEKTLTQAIRRTNLMLYEPPDVPMNALLHPILTDNTAIKSIKPISLFS